LSDKYSRRAAVSGRHFLHRADCLGRGEAEIGFQQTAELIHETGVDYVGPLPPEIQNITVFSSAIHAAAKQPDGAKRLQAFLVAPEAVPVIRKNGMDPTK
jgi:molybdate transport system substrate-binding protein